MPYDDGNTIITHLKRLSDDELGELNPAELTDGGRQALEQERLRRKEPDYQNEKLLRDQHSASRIAKEDSSRARAMNLNRAARRYSWLLAIFLALPALFLLKTWYLSPPEAEGPNQAIQRHRLEKTMAQLSPEERVRLQKELEGQQMADRFVSNAFFYGGGLLIAWLFFFVATRVVLGLFSKQNKNLITS